jgi:hypothetical protein
MPKMPRYLSDIEYVCPKCQAAISETIDVPEPAWTADYASDMTGDDDIDLTCEECDESFWAHVHVQVGECQITLHDFLGTPIHATDGYYDGPDDGGLWDETDPEVNAFGVFLQSHRETWNMLKDAALPSSGSSLMNRMVFAHQISAMEAYLADTVILQVTTKPDALKRLLLEDKDLLQEKFNLAQIAADPDLVKRKVLDHLRSLMYHNLPRVSALYKTAFKIDVLHLLESTALHDLMQAVTYRHDCVHRNGHNKDGEKLEVFTPDYIERIASITHSLVDAIEKKRVIDGFQAAIDAVEAKRSRLLQTDPSGT